jgi:hypothetical protein
MKTETKQFLDKLKECKSLSERKIINDEFSLYYQKLNEAEKKELIPYFDNIKSGIHQKIGDLDNLVLQAENILAKYQMVEV